MSQQQERRRPRKEVLEGARTVPASETAPTKTAFKELTHGRVRYALTLPPADQKARELCVCIHGFSTEGPIYYDLIQPLTALNYAVLTLDLYGRGCSDAAPAGVANDVHLFVGCIRELLSALEEETAGLSSEPITIMGYSMGGAIVAQYSAQYASEVSRTILLAPTGLPMDVPLTARLVHIPLIGPLLFHLMARQSMIGHIGGGFHDGSAPGVEKAREQAIARTTQLFDQHPGFAASILSTLQNFDFHGLREAYAELGRSEKPVLIIWGEEDTVVPHSNLAVMVELVPQAVAHSIPLAGHSDLFGNTDVFEKVTGFISSFLA